MRLWGLLLGALRIGVVMVVVVFGWVGSLCVRRWRWRGVCLCRLCLGLGTPWLWWFGCAGVVGVVGE